MIRTWLCAALMLLMSGCMMTHSTRSARVLEPGRLAAQFDSRMQLTVVDGESDVKGDAGRSATFAAFTSAASGGLLGYNLAEIFVDYGASERLTTTLRLGFASASCGVGARWALIDGDYALSLAGELSAQFSNPVIVYGRVGLLQALALGETVDLLLNGHAVMGLNQDLPMVGGAIGFDLREIFDFGVRPMVEVSTFPGASRSVQLITIVVGLTLP